MRLDMGHGSAANAKNEIYMKAERVVPELNVFAGLFEESPLQLVSKMYWPIGWVA